MTRFTNPWPSYAPPSLWTRATAFFNLTDPNRDVQDAEPWSGPAVLRPSFDPPAGFGMTRDTARADRPDSERIERGEGDRTERREGERAERGEGEEMAKARAMWLGHASVYLQLWTGADEGHMIGVLFDPIFSERCSPITWLGPKRRIQPPCRIEELPRVDLVVISHDHYDHLDKPSIITIEATFPNVRYAVPLGLAKWFKKRGVTMDRIIELNWGEECTVLDLGGGGENFPSPSGVASQAVVERERAPPAESAETLVPPVEQAKVVAKDMDVDVEGEVGADEEPLLPVTNDRHTLGSGGGGDTGAVEDVAGEVGEVEAGLGSAGARVQQTYQETMSASAGAGAVRLICTPGQHNSGRYLGGGNRTLWCTWVLEWAVAGHAPVRVFFGGDTAYRSLSGGPTNPTFGRINARYGAPTLSFLPLAPGSVLPYLSDILPLIHPDQERLTRHIHATPEDAVRMNAVLGGGRAVGIHWGTWTSARGAEGTVKALERARGAVKAEAERELQGGGGSGEETAGLVSGLYGGDQVGDGVGVGAGVGVGVGVGVGAGVGVGVGLGAGERVRDTAGVSLVDVGAWIDV